MAQSKQSGPYHEDDFVMVADPAGNVQPDAVPKGWVGTDLLPAGWKEASAYQVKKSEKETSGPGAGGVPPETATRPELEAYAVEHGGLTAEQASTFDTKADLRAAIVAAKA